MFKNHLIKSKFPFIKIINVILFKSNNSTLFQRNTSEDTTNLTELVNDMKLYLRKLYELHEQFPKEFIKDKGKMDEIENDARKIVDAINQIRNAWNIEDYEKNIAIICGMPQNDELKSKDIE